MEGFDVDANKLMVDVSNSVAVTVPYNVHQVMHGIDNLQNEVSRLTSIMGIMECIMENVTNTLTEIDTISRDITEDVLRQRLLYVARKISGSGVKSSLPPKSSSSLDKDVELNLKDNIDMTTETFQEGSLPSMFDDIRHETKPYEYLIKKEFVVHSANEKFDIKKDDHSERNETIGFPVEGKLSRGEFKLLKFVFDESCDGSDKSSKVVARFGEIVLTRADIKCMRPGNKITRKVINLHAAYLSEAQSTMWFFPTNFSEYCQDLNKLGEKYDWLNTIIIDCKLQRFNRRLKHCFKIFIPIHDDTLDHWFLVMISVRDEVIEIWDSKADMGALRKHETTKYVILLLQKVFASDMKKPGDMYFNFPSFKIIVRKGNQVDVNGFDSGIYLMKYMQLYGEPMLDGFESSKERTELALSIVKNSNNEELRSLQAAVGVRVMSNNRKQTNLDENGYSKFERASMFDKENYPTGRKMRSHRKRKDLA